MHLAEQALEMLKGTELLVLPADPDPGAVPAEHVRRAAAAGDKHGAKPEAIVQHWLDVAGRERAGPQPAQPACPAGRIRSSARRPSSRSWR